MTAQMSKDYRKSKDRGDCDISPEKLQDPMLTSVSNSKRENVVKDAISESTFSPPGTSNEKESKRRWFEEVFFPGICAEKFLPIAVELRKGEHTCRFGGRDRGAYNVVIFVVFDDDVEWVVKMPRGQCEEGEENMFLMSEYATLRFLEEDIRTVPAPKVHASCFSANNPTKTPYFIMDKLPGLPMSRAFREHHIMERDKVFGILRQLAEMRKALDTKTWPETGSFSMAGEYVVVEKQVSNRNFFDGWEKIRSRPGAFESSISYYANLLQESWRKVQEDLPTSEEALLQWKIHLYLSSVLPSYVKPQDNGFILAHTDLNPSNILVDPQTGSITGIIDWEFSCTVPFQATEHFPLILRKDLFADYFRGIYDDPEAELNEWRAFYAKQFEGDPAMEKYLQNIDAAIAFEDILKENKLPTIENLVEKCKFLESAETLETMEVPFPWKSPTKHRFPPPPTTEPESESTPTAEITEIAAETEQDDFPTTNGGDDKSTLSPSSIIDTGHERPAPPSTTEKAEQALLTQQQISHNDSPTTNDEAEKPTIQPSQPLAHTDHADTPAAPPKKAETSVQTDDVSPTTTTVAVQTTFSLPVIHNRPDATTDTLEEAGALSFESRSLNSFVGVVQRRGGLVGGINKFRRGVRSGGMKVWRVVTCRRKRLGEESEKQRRRDV